MVKFFSLLLCLACAGPLQADPLKNLSKKIKSDLKSKPMSLGVLNFFYDRGRMSTGSYLVSERLLTYLVQDGVPVVERRLLSTLLAEQRFAQIGITNIDSLKRAGSFLGVDAVVVGTLSDHPDEANTNVTARVIQVESAQVIGGGSAITANEWPDAPKPPSTPKSHLAVPNISLAEPVMMKKGDKKALSLSEEKPRKTLGNDHYNPPLVPAFFTMSAHRINKRGNEQ